MKVVGKRLHHNIQASCRVNPARDTSGNNNISTEAYRKARTRTKCRMLAKGHVTTRLRHYIHE